MTLTLPWGELKLTDVQLQVALGADGSVERLRGTAAMPFPTFGVFDDARVWRRRGPTSGWSWARTWVG